MLVTMFTDASLINQTKSGGWAMWAKSERGTIWNSGPLQGKVDSSNEAEIKAIANGLYYLCNTHIIERGDTVLVTADNNHALRCVLPPRGVFMRAPEIRAAEMIDSLVADHDLTLRTRHVKAHSGVHEPRLWVHNNCDRHARKHARAVHAGRK